MVGKKPVKATGQGGRSVISECTTLGQLVTQLEGRGALVPVDYAVLKSMFNRFLAVYKSSAYVELPSLTFTQLSSGDDGAPGSTSAGAGSSGRSGDGGSGGAGGSGRSFRSERDVKRTAEAGAPPLVPKRLRRSTGAGEDG